jgi:hypothetical protein
MADNNIALSFPESGYPSTNVETFYSDGVTSISPNGHVIKVYFGRLDGNFSTPEPNKVAVVSQLIMPTDAFIQSTQFFNNIIDKLVQDGVLTPEYVARIRNTAASAK